MSRTCVEAGCYDGVKVTEESSEDEPGALQHKYYAPGVGGVRVGWVGNDPVQGTLLGVRREARRRRPWRRPGRPRLLEKRRLPHSKDVWDNRAGYLEAGVPAGAIVRTAMGG